MSDAQVHKGGPPDHRGPCPCPCGEDAFATIEVAGVYLTICRQHITGVIRGLKAVTKKTARGLCPTCGRRFRLTKNGMVWAHRTAPAGPGYCSGTGKPPRKD